MNRIRFVLPALFLAASALPVQAQIFARKPKVATQVPELISISRVDPDERRRAAAVEQLRDFDTKAYPDIVPILVDVLQTDSKTSVRLEAVNTLSRVRPISQLAGQALEAAAQRDDNWRVRLQAKTALLGYSLAGFRSGAPRDSSPIGPTTKEPPLADSTSIAADPPPTIVPVPNTTNAPGVPTNQNDQVIIIDPTTKQPIPQGSSVSLPRPLPTRPDPAFSTAVPLQPRRVPPVLSNDGPTLPPAPR